MTASGITGVIDLHAHTFYSDGALRPRELLERAKASGVELISVTDHDSVCGLAEAEGHAPEIGMKFIPGIEISSSYKRHQLHFLGYFFDYTESRFLSRLKELKNGRVNRARRIIAKLNRIKIPLKLESVLERTGTENSIGRPHIANTMVEEGFAETYNEVFDKYIGIGRPAYEANWPFPPEEAIKMIRDAGGLSFVAHPSHHLSVELLQRLQKLGMDGVEVVHPSHSPEEMERISSFAQRNDLLMCGGSDFHGGSKNDDANLGRYSARIDWLESMSTRLVQKFGNQRRIIW